MHEGGRQALLQRWARLVTGRPGWVIFAAAVLALGGYALAAATVTFQANRNALIDSDLSWNQRFRAWKRNFSGLTDLYVVVDPGPNADRAERERVRAHLASLAGRLQESEYVAGLRWRFEPTPRMLQIAPRNRFEEALARIRKARLLLQSPTPSDFLSSAMGRWREGSESAAQADPEDLRRFAGLVRGLGNALRHPDRAEQALADAAPGEAGPRYLRSRNGRLYFLSVTPRPAEGGRLNAFAPAVDTIRAAIEAEFADAEDIEAGVTGIKALETDETRAALRDSGWATGVAALLIAVLLVLGLHSLRAPLLALAALAVAIGWTFGFLTLAIGHLQIISVVFAVILLGLGVAFAIHLYGAYTAERRDHEDDLAGAARTMRRVFERVGPGMLTGALTTAAAFGTTLFTDFRGVAEMGLIAGAGVLLCLLAMLTVFPALLRLVKPRHRHTPRIGARRVPFFQERWTMPWVGRPRRALVGSAVVVGLALAGATQLRFDYDLGSLLPPRASSLQWQERIGNAGDQPVWFAVSLVSNLEKARQRVEALRRRPTVGRVGGIGLLFPPHPAWRRRSLRSVRTALAPALREARRAETPAEGRGALLQRLAGLRLLLAAAPTPDTPATRRALKRLQRAVGDAVAAGAALADEQRAARVKRVRQAWTGWRARLAERLDAALNPAPVKPAALPDALIDPYVARNTGSGETRYAIHVYPDLPVGPDSAQTALDPRFLPHFVKDVETVDPQATGPALQIFHSGQLMKRSYAWAGLWAFLAVGVLVWLDFRSWIEAGLSLLPIALGFLCTFGVMGATGMALNPANVIALPLLFGIGVDAGVHMIHRHRQDPRARPAGLTTGTGHAITLTSLTAIIGFGSLTIAEHRGIQNLGVVLAMGLTLTLAACWLVLPPLLTLRQQRPAAQLTASSSAASAPKSATSTTSA